RFVQGVAGAAGFALGGVLDGAEPGRGLPHVSWWPEWRHDGHRSGCSDLPGAIKKPAELWNYFLGAPSVARVEDLTKKPAPAGPTPHGFSRLPPSVRISSRKAVSAAAASRLQAMLILAGCCLSRLNAIRRSTAKFSAPRRRCSRLASSPKLMSMCQCKPF